MNKLKIVFLSLLLTGCTWVKLSEAGSTVRLAEQPVSAECRNVGRVTAMSRAKVAVYNRKTSKLQTELETIARNQAATMGADTIVPESGITGGEQKFTAFACAAETR